MATRTYAGTPPVNAEQLAGQIDAATARTGTAVSLLVLDNALTISVTHAALVAADDPPIIGVIANYVFDPLFGKTPEQKRLTNQAVTLRSWAQDAANEANNWAGQNAATRDAAMKTTFQRISTLLSHMADMLVAGGLN